MWQRAPCTATGNALGPRMGEEHRKDDTVLVPIRTDAARRMGNCEHMALRRGDARVPRLLQKGFHKGIQRVRLRQSTNTVRRRLAAPGDILRGTDAQCATAAHLAAEVQREATVLMAENARVDDR